MQDYLDKSKYFHYLTPKPGEDILDRENDFTWKTHDSIICSVPKEVQKQFTLEEQEQQLVEFREIFGTDKQYMISVINPYAKSNKETRDFAARVIPDLVEAIAVINDSALGRMTINLFVGLRPPTYHLKVFTNSKTAFKWIRELKAQKS